MLMLQCLFFNASYCICCSLSFSYYCCCVLLPQTSVSPFELLPLHSYVLLRSYVDVTLPLSFDLHSRRCCVCISYIVYRTCVWVFVIVVFFFGSVAAVASPTCSFSSLIRIDVHTLQYVSLYPLVLCVYSIGAAYDAADMCFCIVFLLLVFLFLSIDRQFQNRPLFFVFVLLFMLTVAKCDFDDLSWKSHTLLFFVLFNMCSHRVQMIHCISTWNFPLIHVCFIEMYRYVVMLWRHELFEFFECFSNFK